MCHCFLLFVAVGHNLCVKNGLVKGLFVKLIYLVLGRELQRNLNTALLGLKTCSGVISSEFSEASAAPVFRKFNSQAARLHIPSDRNVVLAVSPY